MRRTGKDLILAVFGLLSSVVIAYLLALSDTFLHFAIYGFTLSLLPVGAAVSGALAASGNRLGFRIFPHKPTWLLRVTVIATSIATFFLVYYLDYNLMRVHGRSIVDSITFGRFFQIVLENRKFALNFATLGTLGPFNYLLAAVQIFGFAAGGWFTVQKLYDTPCCDFCDRKMIVAVQASKYSNRLLLLEEIFAQMKTSLLEGRSAEAVQMVFEAPPPHPLPMHRLSFTLWRCDRCPVEFFSMFIKPSGDHVGRVRDYSPSRSAVTLPG